MISIGWGMGGWGVTPNGYRVSFGGNEEVLELDSSDDCTTLWLNWRMLSCTI